MDSIKDVSDIISLIKLLVMMVLGLCTFAAVATFKVSRQLGRVRDLEKDVILINERIDKSDIRHSKNEISIRILQDTGIHTKNSIENIDKTLGMLSENLTGWQGRNEEFNVKSGGIIEDLIKKIPDGTDKD